MAIRKVCVIGMGTMGSQIGIVCVKAGFETAMVETSKDNANKGLGNIESFLQGQEKKGKIDPNTKEKILSRIMWSTRHFLPSRPALQLQRRSTGSALDGWAIQ